MKKKVLVLSGINLVDGGPLSVFLDCIRSLIEFGYTDRYKVIALVGNKELFKEYASVVELIEFPKSKKSWIMRIYYEYIYFYRLSKKIKSDIWISLHDITPNVVALKRYVYCHNSSPFNNMKLSEAKYGWKYYLFSKFYKYLYAINISCNTGVIVQQEWMRKEFFRMYNISNIIVARPSIPQINNIVKYTVCDECTFVYPSYPHYYKNFQVVCQAAKILVERGINNFKVYITIDGSENKYAKEIFDMYKECKNIIFCGILSRDRLYELYGISNCLLFMSKLESWGMPIIEFKISGKSMIVSDLPYSYETVGTYQGVEFVDPNDSLKLANAMEEVITYKKLSGSNKLVTPEQPYANNWQELFGLIL